MSHIPDDKTFSFPDKKVQFIKSVILHNQEITKISVASLDEWLP